MIYVSIFLIVISIPLLFGKGSNFIAGYNTLSAQKKEKYNTKKMCKSLGITFIIISIYIIIYTLLNIENLYFVMVGISILTLILENLYISKKCIHK